MRPDPYLGVSLRIRHDTMTPDEISAALHRKPEYSGLKGARRGKRADGSPWPLNYWCSGFDDGETAEERIASIARFMEEHEEAMKSILATGGEAEIYTFIGVEKKEVGFGVEPATLATLGRIGVTLGLDIFPPTPKKRWKPPVAKKTKRTAKRRGKR
jgi:hypothetical protein